LKNSKKFFNHPQTSLNDIYKVFKQSWQLKGYDLSNKIFNHHPITKELDLIEIWKGVNNKFNYENRRHLFSDIKATFLLIGASIQIINKIKLKKKINRVLKRLKGIKLKDYSKSLSIQTKPIEGESISSWAVRTSHDNLTTLFSLLPIKTNISKLLDMMNLDFLWIPDLMKFFSINTGIPKKRLRKMSLSDFKKRMDKIIRKNKNYRNSKEFKVLWRTNWIYNYEIGLRYCPLCLQQDSIPHFRKIWRLKYITFCFTHNSFLEERCPKCNSYIEHYMIRWGAFNLKNCFNCNADLTEIKPKLINPNDPLLLKTKKFYEDYGMNSFMVFEILKEAWENISLYNLSNKRFNNHPLTIDNELIDLWSSRNRNLLFSKIKAIFLIIGTAIKNLTE